MTSEQQRLRKAWRMILYVLTSTGYDKLYEDEIMVVANFIRKELGLD